MKWGVSSEPALLAKTKPIFRERNTTFFLNYKVFNCTTVSHASGSMKAVILLPEHPALFAHNFDSGMQSFYFSVSKDAIVLQTCH